MASNNRPDEDEDEEESVSGDDSSESTSSSDDSDSVGTEETPAAAMTMSADQIRRNARDLLQSSPGGDPGKTTMGKSSSNAGMPSGYQSYQDAPTVHMSNAQRSNPTSSAANPPWADRASESGLSVTEVASMAFACVAHCLTEGYRAASNYYGGYHQEQIASVSGPNNSQAYRQVAGYGNEAYSSGGPSSGGYHSSGYGDGYQSKFSDKPPGGSKEVMDRGQSLGQGTEQATQQAKEQKEEWATVSVPSTYQGGRVGSGH